MHDRCPDRAAHAAVQFMPDKPLHIEILIFLVAARRLAVHGAAAFALVLALVLVLSRWCSCFSSSSSPLAASQFMALLLSR